jgi:nucleoid DNA-binding protein
MSRHTITAIAKPGTKKALLNTVAIERRMARVEVDAIVEHWLSAVRDEVWRLGVVRLKGFGTFRVKRRKARQLPWIDEHGDKGMWDIPEREVVTFRASKNWRRK